MNSANAYEEIYEVLNHMDPQTVMRIPLQVLERIREIRNPDFVTKIDPNDIFNTNNISKEAVDVLCWLNYSYIIDDERKNSINNKVEEKKREQYDPNKIFESQNIVNENRVEEKIEITEYKKESFFQKLISKIKSIFKK